MKVMTFNIQHARNFLTGKVDYPLMAKTITDLGADICGLNEVYGVGCKPPYDGQDGRIAAELGENWNHRFAEAIKLEPGPYGNGLLTPYPILETEVVLLKSPPKTHPGYYEDRCILKALIDTPEGKIHFMTCHFGLQPEEEALAAEVICKVLDEDKKNDLPTVLMGDFNVTPDNPVLDPIRERLVDTDAFCEGPHLSFPTDKPNMKIDYIFVSKHFKVTSCVVPAVVAADHLPVVAEITLK